MIVKELKNLLKDANGNDEIFVLQNKTDKDGWGYTIPIPIEEIIIMTTLEK